MALLTDDNAVLAQKAGAFYSESTAIFGEIMGKTEENKMEKIPAVSVIIPVYNAQKHLEQMLESVMRQSLKEIEIICIDDGSTDRSADIIRSLKKKDSRISLFTQEHLNAGAARNRGLLKARGEYVLFWDADDRFREKAAELLYRKAKLSGADLCVCGVCEFTDEGKVYETDGYLKTALLPEKEVFQKYDLGDHLFDFASNVLWNKMFRREFLTRSGISFQEIRQANDTAFVMLSMYRAEAVTCVRQMLVYHRVNNPESLTGRASDTFLCPYESYLCTLGKLKEDPDFPMFQKSFRNKAVLGMFRALNIQTSFEAYVQLYQFLKEEGFEALGIHQCRREELMEEWMYRDLELMKELSAGDFLIYKANERRWDRDQLKYTLRRVRRRLSFLLTWNQRMKKIRRLLGTGHF